MTFEIGPGNAPDLIAGLGLFAVAALLLWVAPTNRVHRAFALLQVVNGAASLAYVALVGYGNTDPIRSAMWFRMGQYFLLAGPFAAAFFALRFLDPEGRSRASRPLAWSFLILAVVALAAFAADHDLVSSWGTEGPPTLGPLGLLQSPGLVFGSMALLFVLAARRRDASPRRHGLILASVAFTSTATFATAGALTAAAWGAAPSNSFGTPSDNAVLEVAVLAGRALSLVVVLATITIVLAAPPLRGDAETRGSRQLLVGAAVVASLSGILVMTLALQSPGRYGWLPGSVDGVWRVAMAGMLAYALLRRQVFDTEMRLRFAISRSTVAAVFIAVFFIASEAAQQFFGETLGSTYVGIAAAGALVFAIVPLQRAAERFAEKAVPITPSEDGTRAPGDEGHDLYRFALQLALADRALAPEEEMKLARLAERLGLGPTDVTRLRQEVEAALSTASDEGGA